MHEQNPDRIPRSASVASLALVLLVAAACLFAWMRTEKTPLLVAAIGFLLVSPIWYLAPIDVRKLNAPFLQPMTYRRKFSPALGALSLIGYATILVAIGLLVFR